jgi:O-antigen biosynthesis protein
VDRERQPKPAYAQLQSMGPLRAPLLPDAPTFSVIVCTRNGSRTLEECLVSLERIRYPHFEILVVDDGSTDHSREIIQQHPRARYLFQEPAGLSIARNTGANHASGELLAYTDDDCIVDEDWLTYLAVAFRNPEVAAVGGPNIPPPPQNLSQACVITAPGGPAHVLLTDTTAEHIPGCNLAVRKSAFTEVGGFLPQYHAAGDDVDFCWRLIELGFTIAFHPGAMVWHYRRFSVKAYLKQQMGYGKAEGLLLSQHSNRFGHFGGARWRGTVYQSTLQRITRQAGRIYSGTFGHAPFQIIYAAPLSDYFHLASSFPWLLVVITLLANFSWSALLGWIGVGMLSVTVLLPLLQIWKLRLSTPFAGPKARLLLWFLFLAQPILRSVTRFYWSLRKGGVPTGPLFSPTPGKFSRLGFPKRVAEFCLWSNQGVDRETLLQALTNRLRSLRLPFATDDGWRNWDVEIQPNPWWAVRLTTVTEFHADAGRLTRVRLATKATVQNLLLNILLCISLLAVIFMTPLPTAFFVLGGYLVWWIVSEWMHRRTARRIALLTLQVGAECGLLSKLQTP